MPVDLSPAATLKDPVRRKAAREAVLASYKPSLPRRDIVASVDAIESFTEGMDFEAFRADARTIAALERKLQGLAHLQVTHYRMKIWDEREARQYRRPKGSDSIMASAPSHR